MKKSLRILLMALLVLVVLGVSVPLLFRHFVVDQVMDKGGMMNPDYMDETEDISILDSCVLQKEDGSPIGEITYCYHEVSKEDISGRLIVGIDLAGSYETVEFKKQEK